MRADYLDLAVPLVWSVESFLTNAECDAYIARAEELRPEVAPITTRSGPVLRTEVRNNARAMLDDLALAAELFARIRDRVPPKFRERVLCGVNERVRFYRYDPGQRFRLHYDGAFVRSDNEASELTFMVYLNDDFEGGHTCFPEQELSVVPKRGSALLFQHMLLHEGAEVTKGRKYVLRTDVMYREVAG